MKIKLYEEFNTESILFIVDVQKSFRKFFTEMYLHHLNNYCREFSKVYQIFDNHVDGKSVDKDYLYQENPKVPVHSDLYRFPNQVDLIEKRYNYDVDVDFYQKVLDSETYKNVKSLEDGNKLKKGDSFETKEGTLIVYIGNNHQWYHCTKKLYKLFQSLKGREVIIVGGSNPECLEDIYTTGESIGVKMKRDYKYIYSANHCPIK